MPSFIGLLLGRHTVTRSGRLSTASQELRRRPERGTETEYLVAAVPRRKPGR